MHPNVLFVRRYVLLRVLNLMSLCQDFERPATVPWVSYLIYSALFVLCVTADTFVFQSILWVRGKLFQCKQVIIVQHQNGRRAINHGRSVHQFFSTVFSSYCSGRDEWNWHCNATWAHQKLLVILFFDGSTNFRGMPIAANCNGGNYEYRFTGFMCSLAISASWSV